MIVLYRCLTLLIKLASVALGTFLTICVLSYFGVVLPLQSPIFAFAFESALLSQLIAACLSPKKDIKC